MTPTFKLALTGFLSLLAVGIALGIARDLYSVERGRVTGTITLIARTDGSVKSNIKTPASFDMRLDDGSIVRVAASDTRNLSAGQKIETIEMVMPWGQVWYKTTE